jgi:hypothetical protein
MSEKVRGITEYKYQCQSSVLLRNSKDVYIGDVEALRSIRVGEVNENKVTELPVRLSSIVLPGTRRKCLLKIREKLIEAVLDRLLGRSWSNWRWG